MELDGKLLNEVQKQDLSRIVELINHKFAVEHIFLFAFGQTVSVACGCFTADHSSDKKSYCLMVTTIFMQCQQHSMQDFLNNHLPEMQVTVLCHSSGKVRQLLGESNRFFTRIFKSGLLLYTTGGYNSLSFQPDSTPAADFDEAQKYFAHHSSLAEGFLSSARERFSGQDYKLTLFFLHQATEQTAIGLIRVWMGYRFNIHHLGRLLELCYYFSPKISEIFATTEQDQMLLRKLNRAYIGVRYRNDFTVTAQQAQILLSKIETFAGLSDSLCLAKLALLRDQAGMASLPATF